LEDLTMFHELSSNKFYILKLESACLNSSANLALSYYSWTVPPIIMVPLVSELIWIEELSFSKIVIFCMKEENHNLMNLNFSFSQKFPCSIYQTRFWYSFIFWLMVSFIRDILKMNWIDDFLCLFDIFSSFQWYLLDLWWYYSVD
jgi:hypothetical protein